MTNTHVTNESTLDKKWAATPQELKDAAKRASDNVNIHLIGQGYENCRNSFLAVKLSDGSSDGVLYDTRGDAVRHQAFPDQCYYFSYRNCPGGSNVRELALVLEFARKAYAAGMRLTDPDDQVNGGKEVLMTTAQTDFRRHQMFGVGKHRAGRIALPGKDF